MSPGYRRSNGLTVARRCAYLILAAVLCSALAVSSSASARQTRVYSLKIGDHFTVVGTRINCNITNAGSATRIPTVTCGLVHSGSKLLLPKSYSFSFGDRGVGVFGSGAKRQAIFRAQTDRGVPLGDPAPSERTSGTVGRRLRPVARGLEGVNVARTSVVCVAVAYPKPHGPALNCTLSSRAITKALRKPRLTFRPLTITLNDQWLRVSRMSTTKTQRVVFSRREPAG
jgi:hypothetical protein